MQRQQSESKGPLKNYGTPHATQARMVVPKFVRVVSFYSYLASCAGGGVA
jgi:hypothetical protein